MLIVLAIWLVIGAVFGVPRARAKYHAILAKYPNLMSTEARSIKFEAMIDALLEFIKWMLLGFISGISYIAWILLELAIENRKKLESPNVLGAFGFSTLIFVLGVLALERRKLD